MIKGLERLCQYGAGTPFTISPGISYAGIAGLGYSLACTAVPPPTQKGAIYRADTLTHSPSLKTTIEPYTLRPCMLCIRSKQKGSP